MEAVLIVLISVGVPALVFLAPMWMRSKERHRILEALETAAEKGVVLSPDPTSALVMATYQSRSPRAALPIHVRDMRLGIFLIASAFALVLIGAAVGALVAATGHQVGLQTFLIISSVAAGPGLIGCAYLMLARMGRQAGQSEV